MTRQSSAPDTFYTRVIKPHLAFGCPTRVATMMLLEPVTRALVEEVLSGMRDAGHPMIVWETYRSRERQRSLFARKKTKLKEVSPHHYGLAADFVFDVDGEPSWRGPWEVFGGLARGVGLTWGGDWDSNPLTKNRFDDLPHLQRIAVSEQDSVFSGAWYPSEERA